MDIELDEEIEEWFLKLKGKRKNIDVRQMKPESFDTNLNWKWYPSEFFNPGYLMFVDNYAVWIGQDESTEFLHHFDNTSHHNFLNGTLMQCMKHNSTFFVVDMFSSDGYEIPQTLSSSMKERLCLHQLKVLAKVFESLSVCIQMMPYRYTQPSEDIKDMTKIILYQPESNIHYRLCNQVIVYYDSDTQTAFASDDGSLIPLELPVQSPVDESSTGMYTCEIVNGKVQLIEINKEEDYDKIVALQEIGESEQQIISYDSVAELF